MQSTEHTDPRGSTGLELWARLGAGWRHWQKLSASPHLDSGLPRCLWWERTHRSAGDVGDAGLIPGAGRFPGGGHGNPLQYSCLENPMDSGAWRATVPGVAKSRKWLKCLSSHIHTQTRIASFLASTFTHQSFVHFSKASPWHSLSIKALITQDVAQSF